MLIITCKLHEMSPPWALQCSQREYPVDRDHPTLLTTTLQCTDRPSAINSCCFSGCGQHLACACSDNTVYSMRMPLSLKKTHAFVGESIYYNLATGFCRIFATSTKALKERSVPYMDCFAPLVFHIRNAQPSCQCMTIIVAN